MYQKFDHVEVSLESARIIELISNRLTELNGSMLIIDYGHDGECKDTFRVLIN
jgi:SAM-dependent MidA family methyltransferase